MEYRTETELHPNYEYVLKFIKSHSNVGTRSLDYGCGAAEVIKRGRAEGLDVFGAESFYKGGNKKIEVERLGYLGSIVKEIKQNHLDFPDDYFDLVVSNQVLEHVEDLRVTLRELHRVLKPGGKMLSLFPSREVWSEGHCGIPLLHRFPRRSRMRVYYAALWRALGKGYYKGVKTRIEWSRDFCEWLDSFTFYRTKNEITETFSQFFAELHFIELDYLLFRLARVSRVIAEPIYIASRIPFMSMVLREFVNKKTGMVFVAVKR
jgi:SAM-dependent methyltransferase